MVKMCGDKPLALGVTPSISFGDSLGQLASLHTQRDNWFSVDIASYLPSSCLIGLGTDS